MPRIAGLAPLLVDDLGIPYGEVRRTMSPQQRHSRQQPSRRMPAAQQSGARHGWGASPGAAAGGTPPWSAANGPLEGTIHAPRSRSLARPRRRGRWLTVGVPTVLGGTFGLGSFLVLGVSSLVGGAGLLSPLLAGLGIALVVGGGTRFLLRNPSTRPARLQLNPGEIPTGTRAMLEKIVKDSHQQRRRLLRIRRRVRGPAVTPILDRAETLLLRIDALLGSATLQTRRSSDADMMMLEGMADRYVPELIDALESTVGFLLPGTTEPARTQAARNLRSIDAQLVALDTSIDRLEQDVVDGVTRSLDIHSEFLRARLPTDDAGPMPGR